MTAQAGAGAPVGVAEVRATVARADAVLKLPGRPELAVLDAELRGHIRALLPVAEAAVDRLPHSSLERWTRHTRLDAVRHLLKEAPGLSPVLAHAHVANLAADCRLLLTYADEEAR